MPSTPVETTMPLLVARRRIEAEGVVVLELENPDGAELPAWEPGAHIDLVLGAGLARQYSLCGDPADRSCWRIGILREPDGRGGSALAHDTLRAGSRVDVRGPRNHFPLVPAPGYTFVAGGIGITPLLPMIAAAEGAGIPWQLHYGGRSRTSMAFLGELGCHGERVVLYPQDEVGLIDLEGVLAAVEPGALIYCCGPEPLLAAVEQGCAGRSADALRVERFAPRQTARIGDDAAFQVELAGSGITVTVPAGRSVLETVEAAGVQVLSSCQEGTCGTCETGVLAGVVDHRDSLLSPQERAANDTMFICVSRAVSATLVLDL